MESVMAQGAGRAPAVPGTSWSRRCLSPGRTRAHASERGRGRHILKSWQTPFVPLSSSPSTSRCNAASVTSRPLAQEKMLPLRFSSQRLFSKFHSLFVARKLRGRRSPTVRASLDEPSLEESGMKVLDLPCLPFIPAEVLVPASTKPLHLFEARYLALLDDAMVRSQGLFAHVVLEPVKPEDEAKAAGEVSFVASRCCLTHIQSVRRLNIGALVTVRGICRLRLLSVTQAEPFLSGQAAVQLDASVDIPGKEEVLASKLQDLKEVLREVQSLQIRLKAPGDAPLQTPLEEALQWAEKAALGNIKSSTTVVPSQGPSFSQGSTTAEGATEESEAASLPAPQWPLQSLALEEYLPTRAELVAFAALQPVAGATPAELHKLLQARLLAMETVDTFKRLEIAQAYAEDCRSTLAAKLALQNLAL